MSRDETVVDFRHKEIGDAEKSKRVMAEATRLVSLAPGEWRIWIKGSAERLGIPCDVLEALIKEVLKDREKKAREAKAEERRIEQRAERSKEKAKREEERKAEKDAKCKTKEKMKALAGVTKLPRDQRDAKLAGLAERYDEEVDALKEALTDITESSVSPSSEWDVEPWGEAIPTAALLQALIAKINKHAVLPPHETLAVALWIMLAWVHEVAAHFSPYLIITAPDTDSGKTTLGIKVVGKLTPRPFLGGEPTAAIVFRVADEHDPTLLFDDVDTVFLRKPDLASIFKIGHTRGIKIPRSERVNGERITVWFDPFCPKVCTMIGTNIRRPLYGRCILIKMQPKLPKEKIEEPTKDDDEFKELRRKLKRWSDDNASTLKDAPPAKDFSNNRERDNWALQLSIAQLAGASWRKQALEAAERLCRSRRKPSWLQLLLAEFQIVFKGRCKEISSEAFHAGITKRDGDYRPRRTICARRA